MQAIFGLKRPAILAYCRLHLTKRNEERVEPKSESGENASASSAVRCVSESVDGEKSAASRSRASTSKSDRRSASVMSSVFASIKSDALSVSASVLRVNSRLAIFGYGCLCFWAANCHVAIFSLHTAQRRAFIRNRARFCITNCHH